MYTYDRGIHNLSKLAVLTLDALLHFLNIPVFTFRMASKLLKVFKEVAIYSV